MKLCELCRECRSDFKCKDCLKPAAVDGLLIVHFTSPGSVQYLQSCFREIYILQLNVLLLARKPIKAHSRLRGSVISQRQGRTRS